MDAPIPDRIGRYSIERLLGSGAMGFVYLGQDPELDRQVAIKMVRDLRVEHGALSHFLERFRNEARAAAKLQHANIVQVYDVGDEPGVGPYLVFEYVAGTTLKQRLKAGGPLPPALVLRLAEEIGDAIDTAHSQGIIHRDIKPDNLLLTESGQAKLADFGVARIPNATLTREGQFLGTPCYAAPETLAEGSYGPRSDLFGFAAVLYEVATGVRAFPGHDAVAVAHKVIHDDPAPPREVALEPKWIPKSVEAVLTRALSKDPELRYATAHELASHLHDAYVSSGVLDPQELGRPPSRRVSIPPLEDSPRSRGGHTFIWIMLTLLALGIVLIVFFDEILGVSPIPNLLAIDAGTAPVVEVATAVDASVPAEDSATPDSAVDAGEDATADATTESALAIETMTPHQREEAAKDALDRVRRALARGNAAEAATALAEASALDPENPDIAEYRARLSTL